MTQSTDLGAIANMPGASYRARVNLGFQALASLHYGLVAPDPPYPLMLWGDQSTGKVWMRDPGNSAWVEVGRLGPPFIWTAIGGGGGGGSAGMTGDVKATFRSVADEGWVLMDDGSIGAAGSGATSRANADCEGLFTLLWEQVANAFAPVQNASGTAVARGASAAADWAVGRRLLLPRTLGRALACAGWGSGLSDRQLGESTGEESHLLGIDEMPSHSHAGSTNSTGSHDHDLGDSTAQQSGSIATAGTVKRQASSGYPTSSAGAHSHTVTVASTGGGQPHNTMQPTIFLHFQVKL